jgi:DNA repair protein RadC
MELPTAAVKAVTRQGVAKGALATGACVSPWATLLDDYANRYRCAAYEVLYTLHLDPCGNVLFRNVAGSGSPERIAFPIRSIVADALQRDTRSLVLAHNHPSGNPAPSRDDLDQTRLLARILQPLGIRIDDHVIFARDRSFSFHAHGLV